MISQNRTFPFALFAVLYSVFQILIDWFCAFIKYHCIPFSNSETFSGGVSTGYSSYISIILINTVFYSRLCHFTIGFNTILNCLIIFCGTSYNNLMHFTLLTGPH